MKAYYLVFVLSFIIQWILPSATDKQYRWKLFFTFLPLFVFGAIRVDFGLDYPAYERIYDEMHGYEEFHLDSTMHAEVGYQWLNRILPSFRSLLVLNAFLLSFALGFFCYHNIPKQYLFLALILIYLNPEKNIYGSLVGIRNGLVVTSFLIGFVLVQKRKILLVSLLILLLSTIHKSSVLFLPVAYIVARNKPITRVEVVGWIVGFVILTALGTSGIVDIVDVIISNEYLDRYEGYLAKGSVNGILMVSSSLVLLLVFVVFLFYNRNWLSESDNSIIRMGLLYLVSSVMGTLAGRASYFYDMFFIASVIKIVADTKIAMYLRIVLFLFVIAICYYSMFVVWMGSEWWNHATYYSLIGSW
jgi:transmembrane protein EpsG